MIGLRTDHIFSEALRIEDIQAASGDFTGVSIV